ncbi:hypothetical protein ACWDCL_29635 [Streptomyces sp. NPDC001009]
MITFRGVGDLLLPRRMFGLEILPLWRWKAGSGIADSDRVAEARLGQMHLTVALRTEADGEGDYGFDVAVPCPHDDECTARAWVPAYSTTSCSTGAGCWLLGCWVCGGEAVILAGLWPGGRERRRRASACGSGAERPSGYVR